MQAVLLLAPQIPLLFMGEEWGATQPFCFFTDFHDELADAVREGRRREFERFPEFASEARARAHPGSERLARPSRPRAWTGRCRSSPSTRAWLELVRGLLRIRHEMIVPRLGGIRGHAGKADAPRRQRRCGSPGRSPTAARWS